MPRNRETEPASHYIDDLCGTNDHHTGPKICRLYKTIPILIRLPTGQASKNDIRFGPAKGLCPSRDSAVERFNCLLRTLVPRAQQPPPSPPPLPPSPAQFPRLLCTYLLWHHDIACLAFTAHPIGLNPYLPRRIRPHTSNGPDRDLDTTRARILAWTHWGILYDTHPSYSI